MKNNINVPRSRRQNYPTAPRLDELCSGCSKQQQCVLPLASNSLRVEIKSYRPGHYVMLHGEPRTSVPIVCRGLTMLSRLTEVGDEVALQCCGVGDFLGLIDWLEGEETYSSSGRAVMETIVVFVRPEDLVSEIQSNPRSLTSLFRQIGSQVGTLQRRVGLQAVQDASSRVIHLLLDLVQQLVLLDEKDVTLPVKLSPTIIADMAGLRRETVSRVMAHLQKRRLILQSNRFITIPCLDRLRKASRATADSP